MTEGFFRTLLARAGTLINDGKPDDAIALLKTLAEKQPELPGVEAGLGKAYYQKRDYEQAAAHLELALKVRLQTAPPQAYNVLLGSYLKRGGFCFLERGVKKHMGTTRLSSKGQVILPKSVRDARSWQPGTEFAVEEVPEGVLLRPVQPFEATTFDEVFGCLKYRGSAKTLREMDRAIARRVKGRHDRGRSHTGRSGRRPRSTHAPTRVRRARHRRR